MPSRRSQIVVEVLNWISVGLLCVAFQLVRKGVDWILHLGPVHALVHSIERNSPRQIDDTYSLEGASFDGKTLAVYYLIDDSRTASMRFNDRRSVKRWFKERVCTAALRESVLENGYGISARLYYADGRSPLIIDYTQPDCVVNPNTMT